MSESEARASEAVNSHSHSHGGSDSDNHSPELIVDPCPDSPDADNDDVDTAPEPDAVADTTPDPEPDADTMDTTPELDMVIGSENEQPVYNKSAAYWANIEPTVDGMLGGLGKLSGIDIQSSERFLKTMQKLICSTSSHRALECGAGIGRITANLLTRHYEIIDIVEQDAKFVEQAKIELAPGKLNNRKGSVEHFYCAGLQDFVFENDYDLIWVQWVLNYLNDEDLLNFFIKCRSHLTPNGLLIVKENCTRPTSKEPIPDADDSSITRPTTHFLRSFEEAGLKLVGREKQKRFPKELFPVWTFGLTPKTS